MAEGVRPLCSSLTLLGFGEMVDGASCGHGRGGREGTRKAEGSAGGGRSLKRNRVIRASFGLAIQWYGLTPCSGDPLSLSLG